MEYLEEPAGGQGEKQTDPEEHESPGSAPNYEESQTPEESGGPGYLERPAER